MSPFSKNENGESRRDMTPAEKILWQELRANKLGVHFRRQQVITGFIVDFYCHKAGLVIELDGVFYEELKKEILSLWVDDSGLERLKFAPEGNLGWNLSGK
ncbi:MAG: endonuclease domain-containing protein [Anaerolineales bacterium]